VRGNYLLLLSLLLLLLLRRWWRGIQGVKDGLGLGLRVGNRRAPARYP